MKKTNNRETESMVEKQTDIQERNKEIEESVDDKRVVEDREIVR